MKTAEFGQPAAALPQPGVCRVCRCTEHRACLIETLGIDDAGKRPCGWADHTRTLCDNPKCIAEAKRELGFYGRQPDRVILDDPWVRSASGEWVRR